MKQINNNDIIDSISEFFGKKVTIESKIGDIEGWDSLGQINLFMMLEEKFELDLSPDDIIENDSVRKIIELINKKI